MNLSIIRGSWLTHGKAKPSLLFVGHRLGLSVCQVPASIVEWPRCTHQPHASTPCINSSHQHHASSLCINFTHQLHASTPHQLCALTPRTNLTHNYFCIKSVIREYWYFRRRQLCAWTLASTPCIDSPHQLPTSTRSINFCINSPHQLGHDVWSWCTERWLFGAFYRPDPRTNPNHKPCALSHEPWGMSHAPPAINHRLICQSLIKYANNWTRQYCTFN